MSRGLGDIATGLEHMTKELSLTPDDHPNRPHLLSDLGTFHKESYNHSGNVNDLDKAIEYMSSTLTLTLDDDPGLPRLLDTLGVYLATRFQRLGEMDDIEKAIEHTSLALALTTDGHPNLPDLLTNLGTFHNYRFERLGDPEDLEMAIGYESRALTLASTGPNLPGRLINLGASHKARFERLGELEDLEKSIEYGVRAVALIPDGHPELSFGLANMVTFHKIRFERLGELDDLEKAIQYASRAVALIPEGNPNLPAQFASMGLLYHYRFERLGELTDLQKSIDYQSRGITLVPDGHPSLTLWQSNLAVSFARLHQHTKDPSHLQSSLDSFRRAAKSISGSPRDRFKSAIRWASLASEESSLNPLEAYQTAIDILPQFIWLGTTVNQRYEDLLATETLALDAAYAAIRASNYALALEWLENTRCVVWNQSLMLRLPLGHLQSSHPDLAARLQAVSSRLYEAGSEAREAQASDSSNLEQLSRQHRRLALEYDDLLSHARTLPGFEDLLQPMKAKDLVRAARNGPIVIINCLKSSCDALVILSGQEDIKHIPLPNFNGEKAQQARSEIETLLRRKELRERGGERRQEPSQTGIFGAVLAVLWNDVVKPILDVLGYTSNVSVDNLPQITWCPTGALSFLPLHAAGDYEQPGSRVFDYAISSYTPTLTSLLHTIPSSLSRDSRVLAIGLGSTPDHSSLPGTTDELALVQTHTRSTADYMQLVNDQATTAAVLDALEHHDWVHLACHAHQNVDNPTKSGFFLYDGTLDLTTINRRSFKNKGLAFLSACQTATGDEKLPDEAIHLASGMLMTGYSSVIATMWSIVDEDAPLVADKVYGHLMKEGKVGNGEGGKALHNAVAALREKVGEKEFERWVPYIHIGS